METPWKPQNSTIPREGQTSNHLKSISNVEEPLACGIRRPLTDFKRTRDWQDEDKDLGYGSQGTGSYGQEGEGFFGRVCFDAGPSLHGGHDGFLGRKARRSADL